MAAVTSTLSPTTNTNAGFRAWGSGISAALDTLGFPKTSDTGQIDWTTVAAPTASAQTQGYEIRRFSDTLQSTRPIFMKLSFGSMSSTVTFGNVNVPQIAVSVGTATDGAGTITSATSYPNTTYTWGGSGSGILPQTSGSDYISTSGPCYFANADGSALGILLWPSQGAGSGGGFFMIERCRNADGTASGDGFMVLASQAGQSSGTVTTRLVVYAGTGFVQPSSYTGAPVLIWPSGNYSTLTSSNTVYPNPVFTGWISKLYAPSQLVCAFQATDFAPLAPFSMSHYGTSRTWLPAGLGSAGRWGSWAQLAGSGSGATSALNCFAMRID